MLTYAFNKQTLQRTLDKEQVEMSRVKHLLESSLVDLKLQLADAQHQLANVTGELDEQKLKHQL